MAGRVYQLLNLNSLLGNVRRERMNGRSYIVAPFTSLGPRVLNGSKGALYYPRKEIEANPGVWNNIPLTLGHPVDPMTNYPVSAREPGVLDRVQLGHVFGDRVENGWRKGEAWFDEELTKKRAPEVYQALNSDRPIELSTGLFTDNEPHQGVTNEGQEFDYIARNYRPDHLAILPNQKGACSVLDGCGINVNQATYELVDNPFVSEEQRAACYAKDDPNWDCDAWNDETPKSIPKKAPTKNTEHGPDGRFVGGSGEIKEAAIKAFTAGDKATKATAKVGLGQATHSEAAALHDRAQEAYSDAHSAGIPGSLKKAQHHAKMAAYHTGKAGTHNMNRSFWQRLGEAFGIVFNATTPLDIGGAQEPQHKHAESGEFLPKGAKLGKKQFQTAAERGFAHTDDGPAPVGDYDDDGDENEDGSTAFGPQGDREDNGLEMDHVPLPTDRGPKSPTGNTMGTCPACGAEMAEEGDELECPRCGYSMSLNEGDCGAGAESSNIKITKHGKLVDNPGMPPPVPAPADEMGSSESGGTGMAGSPLHIGPTAGGGTQNMRIRFYLTKKSPLLALNMSHDDIRGHIHGALAAKTSQDKPPPMIHEVHDDHVIYHDGDQHQKQTYEPNEDGDGVKLTGKPVPVKPVTRFEPATNREVPVVLNAQQLQNAVGYLTTNCECWKGKKDLLVNLLKEGKLKQDDIIRFLNEMHASKKAKATVNRLKGAGVVINEKAESSSADQTADTEVESNESEGLNTKKMNDMEEMFKKKDIKGPASLNAYLKSAPPEVRAVMQQALAANQARKQELIGLLTRNYRNPAEKQQAIATLNDLELPQLEVLARGLPPMMQPSVNQHMMGRQPAPSVYGPELDAEIVHGLGLNEEQPTDNYHGPEVLDMPSSRFLLTPVAKNGTHQRA